MILGTLSRNPPAVGSIAVGDITLPNGDVHLNVRHMVLREATRGEWEAEHGRVCDGPADSRFFEISID